MVGITAITVSDVVAFGPFLIAAAIVGVFGWVLWRTESWHMLRRRLWLLVHGKEEIADTDIRTYVNDQTSLAAFQVFAGVPVRTLSEAHTLMEWCRARDVELGVLRLCGCYFDHHARRVKTRWLPPIWAGKAVGVSALCVFYFALMAVYAAISMPSALSVKETGQSFFATETGIRKTWPSFSAATLAAEDCGKPTADEAARTGFSERDIVIMCGVLKDPEFAAFVQRNARRQAVGLVFIAMVLVLGAYAIGLYALRVLNARRLLLRGVDPSLPAAQLELDFG